MIVVVCAGVFGARAGGQDDDAIRPRARVGQKAAATSGLDQTLPSLKKVKAAGRMGSSFLTPQPSPVAAVVPKAKLAEFDAEIRPVLLKSCAHCHGPKNQEGEFRVDTLDPDLLHGDDVDWWLEVAAVLTNGEMPPPDEPNLADSDRSKVVDWLSSEVQVASVVRRAEERHSSFRRMTRYEYNYALQDLLGLPYDFADDLPPETASEDGFTNSSEVLQMSAMQFDYYRDLSLSALKKATVRGERPQPTYWSASMADAEARIRETYLDGLRKRKQKLPEDPEKRKKELEKQAARYAINPNGTHYKQLASGDGIKVTWNYRGARHAWRPSTTSPEVPDVSQTVVVIPAQQRWIIELGNTLPDTGTMRVRVRASRGTRSEYQTPGLELNFGWQASNNSSASEKLSHRDVVVDATADNPQFYQWDIPLSEIKVRNPMRRTTEMGVTPSPSEYIQLRNTAVSQEDIQVDYVEITAPWYDQWPPASHTRIFIDSAHKADESIYAREVLANFMSRAWRQPVTDTEVDQKTRLFEKLRPECADFEEAMIEVLATVLSSPRFLYLARAEGLTTDEHSDTPPIERSRLTQYELASRLSFFLWSSMPDEELIALAAASQLSQPDVLTSQTQRMLADDRSQRFAEHFMRQWLGMQLLDFLNVDRKAYPQFDRSLKESMQEEPVAFFNQVLKNNFSVLDFVHSDYAMVNERLARHYGLRDVYGNQFRRVSLSPESMRGGLLAQAGLLAMNSDGKDSHPLKRGIWLLERLLNDPPPPPPPAVPEIDLADPEIAKLTLKERIEDHRNHAACLSCHAKIDPWGIAFENFDAAGSWRTKINNVPVDASSELFNGQTLDGIDGLKRYLLSNHQDQFVRAIVYKLTTYALGRPLAFGDRSDIDQITAGLRQQGDGLATLVTLIVNSQLFQSK